MAKIVITDYIKDSSIEKKILGDLLSPNISSETEVLIVWHMKVDKNLIDSLPNLRGIQRYGVGFDNIDTLYARSLGIDVCNTPDYGTDEVSDTALAMILCFVRRIVLYDELSRDYIRTWQENTISGIKRNSHIKVGIIGAGRIGGSLILKCNALKFQTYFYDPYLPRGSEKLLNCKRVDSIEELLGICDVISIHTPLNDETIGIIDGQFVSMLKEKTILINTARGKLITDLDILYGPIIEGRLCGVGLDVLPEEPPRTSKLIDSWRNNEKWLKGKLLINPHTAYFSDHAFEEMRSKTAENALRIYRRLAPFNIVN